MLPQSLISHLQSLSLSISHSGGRAFCALVENGSIGADIERIEPRDWQFVEDYFTANEVLQVRQAPAEPYETLISAIWSAKEAALKALRLGLTVDTRSVSCLFPALEMTNDWITFDIIYDRHLLELADVPSLAGWWRRRGDFVLTVAATRSGRPDFDGIVSKNHMLGLGGVGGAWGGTPSPKPLPFTQRPARAKV